MQGAFSRHKSLLLAHKVNTPLMKSVIAFPVGELEMSAHKTTTTKRCHNWIPKRFSADVFSSDPLVRHCTHERTENRVEGDPSTYRAFARYPLWPLLGSYAKLQCRKWPTRWRPPTADGYPALRILFGGASTFTGRKLPSLLGMSGAMTHLIP